MRIYVIIDKLTNTVFHKAFVNRALAEDQIGYDFKSFKIQPVNLDVTVDIKKEKKWFS